MLLLGLRLGLGFEFWIGLHTVGGYTWVKSRRYLWVSWILNGMRGLIVVAIELNMKFTGGLMNHDR